MLFDRLREVICDIGTITRKEAEELLHEVNAFKKEGFPGSKQHLGVSQARARKKRFFY